MGLGAGKGLRNLGLLWALVVVGAGVASPLGGEVARGEDWEGEEDLEGLGSLLVAGVLLLEVVVKVGSL